MNNLMPLTVLVRSNMEEYTRYVRIFSDLSKPCSVGVAAMAAYFQDLKDNDSLDDDDVFPGDVWLKYGCEIVGIAEGHFNIATSGCDTVSSLCSNLRYAIDSGKPQRVALVSVFVGDDDNDPGYDTFLSVVAASHDTAAVIAAVKADYEDSAGPGSWEDNGAFIVGMGEGAFRGTWDTNGLADSDIAAVCAGVLGGVK